MFTLNILCKSNKPPSTAAYLIYMDLSCFSAAAVLTFLGIEYKGFAVCALNDGRIFFVSSHGDFIKCTEIA